MIWGNHFTDYCKDHDVLFPIDTGNIIFIVRRCQQDGKNLILNSNVHSSMTTANSRVENTIYLPLL